MLASPITELHTLLTALDTAGVPLGLEPGWVDKDAELRRRVSNGIAIPQAIESCGLEGVPTYRRLVRLVSNGVPLEEVLERLHSEASLRTQTQRKLTHGLAYPAFVIAAAGIGILLLGWAVLPLIEAAYSDLRQPPGAVLQRMLAVRDSASVWLIVVPMAFVFLCWIAYRAKPLRATHQSFERGPTARLAYSGECHDTASLLEAGAGPQAADADTPPPPPLLAWARRGDATAEDFRAIGKVYDTMARNGSEAYAAWLPLVAMVLLGGGAALLYALTLFAPVVELLWTLSY